MDSLCLVVLLGLKIIRQENLNALDLLFFDEAHYSADSSPLYAKPLMELSGEHFSNLTISSPSQSLTIHLIPNMSDSFQTFQTNGHVPIIHTNSQPDHLLTTHSISSTKPTLSQPPTAQEPHLILDNQDNISQDIINTAHRSPEKCHLFSNPFDPFT